MVIDLRIPKTAPDLPRFRRSLARPDVRLPSVVVLMGPNGSGKTKLLLALRDVAHFASSLSTPRADDPATSDFEPFLATRPSLGPTRIRVEVEADWLSPGDRVELFRYELAVGVPSDDGPRVVVGEALAHFPHRRSRRLLERGAPGTAIYAAGDFGLRTGDERLKAVRGDASVIATLAALNVPLAQRIGDWLRRLFAFASVSYDDPRRPSIDSVVKSMEDDPDLATWINDEIQRGDLGIDRVKIFEWDEKRHAVFDHHGLDSPVIFMLESTGTKRLFRLLPALYSAFACGAPVCLDDFDSGLHVDMASRILHHFQSPETNGRGAQLFAAAHNVGLLDDLEKEELFIVEKDESGVTRVHGAQDVRGLRRVHRLYPKYRSGALGGVPRFG